jgi:flavin-binding monooxygenase-like protein
VVVATGYQHTPSMPDLPGTCCGELLHASDYGRPRDYAGKRVLVVGSGSSGMEIAHDLATGCARKVWLSIRTPPNIMPRNGPAGLPNDVISVPLFHLPTRLSDLIATSARRRIFGDLSRFGLPIPAEGPFARAHRLHVAPTVIDAEVIDAIRGGSVQVVSAVTEFDGGRVVLSDGSRVDPDVVICATGYRTGLNPLVGHLGVLDSDGVPVRIAPMPAADGLYFHGLLSRPALIGYVAKQSRKLAKHIARSAQPLTPGRVVSNHATRRWKNLPALCLEPAGDRVKFTGNAAYSIRAYSPCVAVQWRSSVRAFMGQPHRKHVYVLDKNSRPISSGGATGLTV